MAVFISIKICQVSVKTCACRPVLTVSWEVKVILSYIVRLRLSWAILYKTLEGGREGGSNSSLSRWRTPMIQALRKAGASRSLSSRPAWSTYCVPGQPKLQKEKKKRRTKRERKQTISKEKKREREIFCSIKWPIFKFL